MKNFMATIIMKVLNTHRAMFKPRCCLFGLAGGRSRTSSGSMYMHLSPPRHVFVSIALHLFMSNLLTPIVRRLHTTDKDHPCRDTRSYIAIARGGSSWSIPGSPVTGVFHQGRFLSQFTDRRTRRRAAISTPPFGTTH